MGTCDQYTEQISSLVDGVLPEEAAVTLRGHLATCADCGHLLLTYQAISAELANLEATPPAALSGAVMARIRVSTPRKRRPPILRRLSFAGVAALLLLVCTYAVQSKLLGGGNASDSTSSLSVASTVETEPEEAPEIRLAGSGEAQDEVSTQDAAYGSAAEAEIPAEPPKDASEASEETGGVPTTDGKSYAGSNGGDSMQSALSLEVGGGQLYAAADANSWVFLDAATVTQLLLSNGTVEAPPSESAQFVISVLLGDMETQYVIWLSEDAVYVELESGEFFISAIDFTYFSDILQSNPLLAD